MKLQIVRVDIGNCSTEYAIGSFPYRYRIENFKILIFPEFITGSITRLVYRNWLPLRPSSWLQYERLLFITRSSPLKTGFPSDRRITLPPTFELVTIIIDRHRFYSVDA